MKGKTKHSQYVSNDMPQMSDNMCISCLPAAVPAYWDPRGSASYSFLLGHNVFGAGSAQRSKMPGT